MRSCEEFALLASLAVDGEASEEEQAALAAHLEVCPACRAYFEDIRAIHEAFAPEVITLPENFAAGVMERVRETAQDPPVKTVSPRRWRRWVPGAVLAACCALAVLGVWRGNVTRFAGQSMIAADSAAPSGEENAAPAAAEPAEQAEAALELDAAPPRSDAKAAPAADEAPQPDGFPAEDAGAGSTGLADSPAGQAADAPAAAAPAVAPPAVHGERYGTGGTEPGAAGETVMLTTASPAAAAWVEEYLGLPWAAGEVFRLTEDQYGELRAALAEAGEAFSEETLGSSGGVWLVRAQSGENP